VTVIKPNGGEIFRTNDQDTVRWTATDNLGIDSVSIYYSTNGGSTFPYTMATGETNDGVYLWTIPGTLSGTCRVKVVAYDAALNQGSDTSDGDFIIAAQPSIPVPTLSPLGVVTLFVLVALVATVLIRRRLGMHKG